MLKVISRQMRQILADRDMSISAAADWCNACSGLSRGVAFDILNGKGNPTIKSIERMLVALKMEIGIKIYDKKGN